ncbi:MAG: hypothetical protein HYU36_15135 [Planctomycetes bacterium]|nr:hypothetical protein [Planctomycetota bacterium]
MLDGSWEGDAPAEMYISHGSEGEIDYRDERRLHGLFGDELLEAQKNRHGPVFIEIPVLCLHWKQLPLVGTIREDLVLDRCEIRNVTLRKLRERNFHHLGIHVMNVVPEAAPDSGEGIGTFRRNEAFSDEQLRHFGDFEPLLGSQAVTLKNEAEDALCYGLGDHDGAQEIPIAVELQALRGRGGKMMVRKDALTPNLQASFCSLPERKIELRPK